ncbi:predicted protein [Micromonas commoda]|uniref:ribonuclease H n=1 Tax=Micromonas commoda (strain RCC299 / NOUM17 / CCMP2709) TaxID=296587 RepID=C1FGI2_MICCC|nr:predicted protein [Micromonas commoda]ACO69263.1 predicted protein [Micromonas commoda]|eukprot:XP_002508005.1 predicted protein [Micromonas commoda]
MSNPSVPGLLSFFFLFLAFLSSPAVAHPNFPGGCSALTGHGVGSYGNNPGYWKLELDGGNTASLNDRVVVKLYDNSDGGYPFKGFILKTSAGTLTAKSSHAAAVSACTGAIGHTESSGKTVAEAYLDLPSSEGTVTVTAEVVYSKTWVSALTLDIEVVKAWTQVGNDIDGTSQNDQLGNSVSMNTDGTRMAVGARGSNTYGTTGGGYLRVYQYDQTKSPAWQQMGPDIPGGAIDYEFRGEIVSMSGDGTKVVSIGGAFSAAAVKVHEWSGASQEWTAMPGFPPAEQNGYMYAVAMSSDGMRVALVKNDVNGISGIGLFVYELGSGGTWSHVNTYPGLSSSNAGYAVALSANGIRVVVGIPEHGVVQVYDLKSPANVWEQVGETMSGGSRFGTSVAISADGTRLVAGHPGSISPSYESTSSTEPYARAYTLNSGSWVQLGSDVKMGQTSTSSLIFPYFFGSSVDMSDDGSLIAIRAVAMSAYGASDGMASTHLYSLNSATNDWEKTGTSIKAEEANDAMLGLYFNPRQLSLAGNGNYVAIGAPGNDGAAPGAAGHVRVYKNPSLAQGSPAPAAPAPPSSNSSSSSCSSSRATGGNVTTFGEYTIHTFTSSGTFTVTDSSLTEVEVLVVGGGGGGGGTPNTGGGGGGGAPNFSEFPGSNGGSGIVIVRYKSATCSDQSCATDYYHDGASCVACPTGSNRLPDTANQCLCPKDYYRSHTQTCAACPQGTTRPAGDTVPGGDATACSAEPSSSPSPSSSSSSPNSAQDKKAAAEKTRDSILADITDARLKAKAKLLADAAIAGVKVQRLTAKLPAADEDAACSTAFTKAEMSASDGACVAKAASSGKRRLSATTYDVEIMFSSAVVSDDALTKAADALKANGVEGVTSKTSVDPIAELKVIPGIDTSKLQTFDKEATEAAAAAPSVSTPAPPPPPPPPSPPPPSLVQDDDDAATGGAMGKPKFYGVARGRAPGVYATWDEARAQVDGIKGAVHKSFSTREEAARWVSARNPDISGTMMTGEARPSAGVPDRASARSPPTSPGKPRAPRSASSMGGARALSTSARDGGDPIAAAEGANGKDDEARENDAASAPPPTPPLADGSYTLYFDGASRGNPGPAGAGALIRRDADSRIGAGVNVAPGADDGAASGAGFGGGSGFGSGGGTGGGLAKGTSRAQSMRPTDPWWGAGKVRGVHVAAGHKRERGGGVRVRAAPAPVVVDLTAPSDDEEGAGAGARPTATGSAFGGPAFASLTASSFAYPARCGGGGSRSWRWPSPPAIAAGAVSEARGWIGSASRLRRSVAVAVPGPTHAPSHNVVAGASRASSSSAAAAAAAAHRWLPILRGSVRWMSRLVA